MSRSIPVPVLLLARGASRSLPFILFLAVWEAVAKSGLIDPAFFPPVEAVGAALLDLGKSPVFYLEIATTLGRSLGGLALGGLIGIPLGAGMAISRGINGFFGPLVKATYSLPKTALIPLLVLWLGIGSATNMAAVLFSTLLPFVVYTYHGVAGVPQVLVWSARAMGVSERRILWKVLLPGSQHAILTGLRIALGFSLVIAIAAEMIAAHTGIGKLMFIYGESGSYDYMFAAVTAIVVLAFLADRLVVAASAHLLRWADVEDRLE
ncbi:MAG TPA: ABC transporter permease subunit [Xanthobacteraceae bacterium]|jgi:NitT/TauT family transport system permease protein